MIKAILKAIAAFILVLACAIILSIVDFDFPEERDYTGITEHCIPVIAYYATFNERIVKYGNLVSKYPKFGLKQKAK